MIIIQLGILCWGSYELWGIECVNEIKSNSIYTMSEISVIVGHGTETATVHQISTK